MQKRIDDRRVISSVEHASDLGERARGFLSGAPDCEMSRDGEVRGATRRKHVVWTDASSSRDFGNDVANDLATGDGRLRPAKGYWAKRQLLFEREQFAAYCGPCRAQHGFTDRLAVFLDL